MKKKVDARLRTLIENGVKTRHRSMICIVGDKGKDQVINLHYILSKTQVKARPSVLWCYKKDLGFTTHKKKRMKEIKKQVSKGVRSADDDDPFELFVSSTDIRYTYYKDSHKVLGQTFGMLVLQDFEALTPNLLARTIETVEGGGLIIFLMKSVSSLKQLYTLTMDVHSRFRTEAHQDVVGRFNERFILSLGGCDNCIVVDDELNVLPISSKLQRITPVEKKNPLEEKNAEELQSLKDSLKDTEPIGSIISAARTLEQGKAVLTFVEAISEKSLRSTVTLTAARGRGKSAALGLAISSAVAFGYSNIFVTSPTPENLRTLFEFVFKGFDTLQYKEHLDYEIIESTNPDFNKAIVRVNIFRSHRQTIQYIHPEDFSKLGQAELLVIDEAAAIPLPIVKNMLGPYLVFMSSTINGYEGTGRSLSLKLISQLRQQNSGQSNSGSRILREIELKDPIRYAPLDPIEKWLNDILCLDASSVPRIPSGYPSPSECELYYVNRDTLFSFHKSSESFLQRMVSLFVSSHYKNTPDDLLLMSDAPAHHLFVLLGPVDEKSNTLPEILCAVQVCLEGQISKRSVLNSLSQGKAAAGDLIPWTVSQQFQDNEFPSLSGGRVVRIATNSEYQKMGYGSRALELLASYYQGDITNISENEEEESVQPETSDSVSLLTEEIKPRKNLPPLLLPLKDRKAERLHYLGVSFGATQQLYTFWKKAGYIPVYLRQTTNEITGEHTCVMLKNLRADDLEVTCDPKWIELYAKDFSRRFLSLLGYNFSKFPCSMAISILDPSRSVENPEALTKYELDTQFSPFDLKRLEGYTNNLVDYHVIMDLLPLIARLFFSSRFNFNLSAGQSAILLGLGLQHKNVDEVAGELNLPVNQVLALFNKAMRKVSSNLRSVVEKEAAKGLPQSTRHIKMTPTKVSLKEDLEEAASEYRQDLEEETKKLLSDPSLKQFAVGGRDEDWEAISKSGAVPSAVSVKSANGKRKQNYEERNNNNNKQGRGGHKKQYKRGKQ